jgi:hypothetical protein
MRPRVQTPPSSPLPFQLNSIEVCKDRKNKRGFCLIVGRYVNASVPRWADPRRDRVDDRREFFLARSLPIVPGHSLLVDPPFCPLGGTDSSLLPARNAQSATVSRGNRWRLAVAGALFALSGAGIACSSGQGLKAAAGLRRLSRERRRSLAGGTGSRPFATIVRFVRQSIGHPRERWWGWRTRG